MKNDCDCLTVNICKVHYINVCHYDDENFGITCPLCDSTKWATHDSSKLSGLDYECQTCHKYIIYFNEKGNPAFKEELYIDYNGKHYLILNNYEVFKTYVVLIKDVGFEKVIFTCPIIFPINKNNILSKLLTFLTLG